MKISLKAARVNANLTQSELARAVGVTKMTINAWENGRKAIKPAYLLMISRVTGCPIDDLILPKVVTKSKSEGK